MPTRLHVAARFRILLARRPWIYWCAVVAVAAAAGLVVKQELDAIDAARRSWEQTRPVLVARHDLEPDGPLAVDTVVLPLAAIPPAALESLPDGARVHQRVATGEVLVDADLVGGGGPARHAVAGQVVVGLVDPLSPGAAIGQRVTIAAEGIVVAAVATIVDLADDVVFVAVQQRDGPAVAAAARAGLASLLFLP